MSKFEPSDFLRNDKSLGDHIRSIEMSDKANKKLAEIKESWKAEMLKDAVVVYGNTNTWTTTKFGDNDKCKALLIQVEPIVKEPCKHEPSTMGSYEGLYYLPKCIHCGVELVAEWKQK